MTLVCSFITAAAFLWAHRQDRAAWKPGTFNRNRVAITAAAYGTAIVLSLVAWLVWSIAA